MTKLCDYGCGNIAKYQLKNGKWCCEKYCNSCPSMKSKNSKGLKRAYKEGRKSNNHLVNRGYPCGWENKTKSEINQIHQKSAETLKRRIKSGDVSVGGHKHTKQAKEKISKARIKFLEENPNQNINWYTINGKRVQGKWEKRLAERLNELDIKWNRVALKYDGHRRYTPDFYLPEYDLYLEVKGFMRERDKYKMWRAINSNKVNIKIIENFDDIENFDSIESLQYFHDKYPYDSIDFGKFINYWD